SRIQSRTVGEAAAAHRRIVRVRIAHRTVALVGTAMSRAVLITELEAGPVGEESRAGDGVRARIRIAHRAVTLVDATAVRSGRDLARSSDELAEARRTRARQPNAHDNRTLVGTTNSRGIPNSSHGEGSEGTGGRRS